MAEELQFATSKEFWESLDKFPMNIKGKILDVWNRMQKNPWDMNLHAEKVKSTLDDRIWSCRVDDNYRLIWHIYQFAESQIILSCFMLISMIPLMIKQKIEPKI